MVVLDAYGLIALLLGEPAAVEVRRLASHDDLALSAVNFAEALDHARRVHGMPREEVEAVIEALIAGGLRVRPFGGRHARRAAEFRATYYHRRRAPLSLADVSLLASVRPGEVLATSDPPVAEVARKERIALCGLPDSKGNLP